MGQKEVNYWLERAKKKKQLATLGGDKKAEKMVLGYEHPTHGLRTIIIYKETDNLSAVDYTKPFYRDSEGFIIGVRRERIYNDLETMLEMWEIMKKEGFLYEKRSASHYELKKIFEYAD